MNSFLRYMTVVVAAASLLPVGGIAIDPSSHSDQSAVNGLFVPNYGQGIYDVSGNFIPADGRTILDFSNTNLGDVTITGAGSNGIKLLKNDKTLIIGSFTGGNVGNASNVYVARLNSDGTIDQAFNPGGTLGAVIDINDDFSIYSAFLLRVNPDGSFDKTFGQNGTGIFLYKSNPNLQFAVDIVSSSQKDRAYVLFLQPDAPPNGNNYELTVGKINL
jgi:hypothetical protein